MTLDRGSVEPRILSHRKSTAADLKGALAGTASGRRMVEDLPHELTLPLYFGLFHARYAKDQALIDASSAVTRMQTAEFGDLLFVEASQCRKHATASSETPAFTLTPRAVELGSDVLDADYLSDVYTHMDVGQHLARVLGRAGIVVLADRRRAWESGVNCYSLSKLGGTVFTDWTPEPFRLAESLVHESAHSWLDEWFAEAQVSLPPEPMIMSPWKHELRPPFGIIHAVVAFSTLCDFYASSLARPDLSSDAREYCEQRRQAEFDALTAVRNPIQQVIELIGDVEIRNHLRDLLSSALDS